MAFVVDRENFRTFDPDRGYELFVIGGGSDGVRIFRLIGPLGQCSFSAHVDDNDLRPPEMNVLGVEFSKKPIVWIIHYWEDKWRILIREAMCAYLINHGCPIPNYRAFVRFGEKGNVFD